MDTCEERARKKTNDYQLTITIDQDVYDGLYRMVGKRKISSFIESLVGPHVMYCDIHEGYRQMAADAEREAEAIAWVSTPLLKYNHTILNIMDTLLA